MSNIVTGAWIELTTPIETHLALQFGATVPEVVALDGNYIYKNVAKRDIKKGEDVVFKDAFDSFYEVDGERLVQIAKYSKDKNKIQCYNGKNGILNDTVVYYTGRGNMFAKQSRHTVKQTDDRGAPVRVDLFANARKHSVPQA